MAVKKFSLEAVIDLTDKMTKPMQNVEKSMTGFSKKMTKNFGGVSNDIKSVSKGIDKVAVGAVAGAAALGAGAFAVGKSFVDAGAEVEKYKTTLTTMLGSQEAANKRFDEMSQFAASTPFELNQVVELGNQLQALGQYSKENMTLLGDLAAASGKPIEQVTNAFAKLVSGQKGEAVNMFRDLLISNKDWVEATGKGVKKTGELMATTDEMLAALPKILGKKGFSGMMDNLSKSYEGMSSNFQDSITRFKQNIGTMLLPAAKNLMGVLTKKMMEFSDISTEKGKKFVASITKFMDDLAVAIEKFDLAKFLEDVGSVIRTIKGVIDFLKPLAPIIIGLIVAVKAVTVAMTIFNAVLWVMSLNPVTLTILGIIAGVVALTLAINALVKNWDAVKKFFADFGNGLLILAGPVGFIVNNLLILGSNIAGIGAAFKNGGILEGIQAIGASILESLIKPIAQFLTLLSKIPVVGGALKGAANLMTEAATGAHTNANLYASPDTRVAESRMSTTSTTRSVVDLKAPAGWGMMPQGYGGAPRQTLNFGGAQ